jgi:cytochrome P450
MALTDLAFIFAMVVVAQLTWTTFIYPIIFSPLSRIPAAHPLARISSWWITSVRYKKVELRTIHAAHERLGPIILLGPEEISVNCVKGGIQTVYSGGFEKGDWYDIFANYPDVRNMFSMPCSRSHASRKRMLSNIYSKSFLQASPTLAAITKQILFGRFLPRLDGFAANGESFDIYSEISGITMDFVTGYQFGLGQSSNFIQDVELRTKWLDWYTSRIGFNFWPQECPRLTAFFERLGFEMVPDHVPKANREIEKWSLAMCDEATTYLRKSDASKVEDVPEDQVENFPMVFSQMMAAMSRSRDYEDIEAEQRRLEIASEMLDHLAAGFDTSGITLCYVVHELSQHPDLQAKLREELLSLDPPISLQQLKSGTPDLPTAKVLDALLLLDAVLQETLRLHSAIPGPEPRITPPGGCSLGPEGEYGRIPGGIRISAQAHSLHRNGDVFPKPGEWLPNRWLDASEEKLKEMRKWFWAFGSGGRMCVGSNLAIYRKCYSLVLYADKGTNACLQR